MDPFAWSVRSILYKLTATRNQYGLDLDAAAKSMLHSEDLSLYLPPFSLKGKTVLDLGACCGETAHLFAENGASKVICVEPAPDRVKRIRNNSKKIKAELLVLEERFEPERHLSLDYDFIKCDIEGYEILMLPYAKALKPCVVEVHNWYLKEQFENGGFNTKLLMDQMLGRGIMVNWAVGPTTEVAVTGKRL